MPWEFGPPFPSQHSYMGSPSHELFCTTSNFIPGTGAADAEVWCKVRVGITEQLQKAPGDPAAVVTIFRTMKHLSVLRLCGNGLTKDHSTGHEVPGVQAGSHLTFQILWVIVPT